MFRPILAGSTISSAHAGTTCRNWPREAFMLELAKAVSFLICILSLYWAGFSAFFVPGTQWEERMWVAGFKLLAAAAICFYSGMVFSWPSKANPTAFQRLTATLPVRLFFWALGGLAVLFTLSWYLADSEAQAMSLRGF